MCVSQFTYENSLLKQIYCIKVECKLDSDKWQLIVPFARARFFATTFFSWSKKPYCSQPCHYIFVNEIVFSAPSDFISAFASPRISRTTAKTGEKTQKVEEVPGTSSRERRVQNRRQEEEEKLSNASEEPSTRRTDKSELRLERLNDTPVDETPSRRRRRTRKALDSKSSADSSLVSTPDCESSPAVRITPEDQESTSKIPDSSTPTLDVQSESPVPEKIETPTDEPSSLPDEENQVADDDEPPFSKLVENEECVRTSENPEVPDTVADDKDSTVKKKVAEETSESVEPEEVSGKMSLYT